MNIHDDPDDDEFLAVEKLQMRLISDEQFHKFEDYAAEIFSAFGLDLNTPSTKDTPRRFIKALFDATERVRRRIPSCCGSSKRNVAANPTAAWARLSKGRSPSLRFANHHALPFYGVAYIGYIAHENIIGHFQTNPPGSAFFPNVLQCRNGLASRSQIRWKAMLHPHGVAVYLQAHHLCVEMRGVRENRTDDTHYSLARSFRRGRDAESRILHCLWVAKK